MDCRGELQSADHACGYGYYYASVIGSGTAELIEGVEKLDALSALMRHMAGREDTFTEDQARGVAVLAIRVKLLSAKAKSIEKAQGVSLRFPDMLFVLTVLQFTSGSVPELPSNPCSLPAAAPGC